MNFKKTQNLILFILLFLSQYLSNAQAPDLKSAMSYNVFAGAGAITNSGLTDIAGDAGYNTGSISGFPPGIINGSLDFENAQSAIVNTDVTDAYAYMLALTCGTTIGTTLGNGQILTSGVYCLGAASTLVGNLILDGQNDPNAEFIFKIDGAFATADFSEITLINLASPCNIYWSVTGAFASGDSSIFKGTIIGDGELALGLATDLEGRALTRTGAIILDSSSVYLPASCLIVLPIELINFSGKFISNNEVEILWSSASEINNLHYTLEKSIDCKTFEEITKINGLKNSFSTTKYLYLDKNVYDRTLCYRLKQTDYDGAVKLLKTIIVHSAENLMISSIILFPNPHYRYLNITDEEASVFNYSLLTITNSIGKIVFEYRINEKQTVLETNLKPGVYYYIITKGNSAVEKGKLIVL